ncbi:MAG: adenylate/guanylate cyclase domain-containing protein [Sulfitobacter sp.]
MDNDQFLTSAILETYLGRISGQQVLEGHIERGDGQQIDCAIFYSDLRGSVALSQHLDTQQYLDAVNAFFDCTANAVTKHGGEVLKFIGDGVLAIFPTNDASCSRANICAAALASAREAFARADHTNRKRQSDGLPALQFGIALHVGSVIYGNVGTTKRLDFTATGPAVGMAARVEQLTRSVDASLLATADFAAHVSEEGIALPPQTLRGFPDDVSLVSYPVKN